MRNPTCILVVAGLAVLAALPGCRDKGRSGSRPGDGVTISRVALITGDDDAWSQAAQAALGRLAREQDVQVEHRRCEPAQVNDVIADLAGEGFGLILLQGGQYVDVLPISAPWTERTVVVCLGANDGLIDRPVAASRIAIGLGEGTYLCGTLAARLSQTHRAVAIGPQQLPMPRDAMTAFLYAIAAAGARTRATLDDIPLPSDEQVRRTASLAIREGVDMLLDVTGRTGALLEAAGEAPNIGVFACFNDASGLSDAVVASVVVDLDGLFARILRQVRADELDSVTRVGLADGSVKLVISPAYRDRIDPATLAEVQRLEQAIRAGQVDVLAPPSSADAPPRAPGD